MRVARLALVAGLAGTTISAVLGAGTAPAAPAAEKVVLRVALTSGIDTLNPFTAKKLASTQVGRFMYEFLTTYTADGQKPTEGLAERWEQGPDRLTWTFTIRKGMTWSDGVPITAKDVAFTYRLMMTNADAKTVNGSYTDHFASVTATDDHTLMIKTRQPYASMLDLDVPVVPEHIWSSIKDIGDFTNQDTSRPVAGSGPFVLTGYQHGRFVTLRANERYWQGRPRVDEVRLVSYTDTDAAAQALRKGEVDVVSGLTPNQFRALSGQPGIQVNDGQSRRFSSLLINPGAATKDGERIGTGNPALTDVDVRRAIARALDLPALVDRVWRGYAHVGASIIPPVFPAYHWEPGEAQRRTFDPAAANMMLAKAGYPLGPDGERVDNAGKRLTLRLLVTSGDPVELQAAQFISEWLGDIGIKVTPEFKSGAQVRADLTGGGYDLAFSGWGVRPDPDQALAYSTCAQRPEANGRGGTTTNFFCNRDYDRLYAKQAAEPNPAKRAGIVKSMQALLYDQVPEVMLCYPHILEAYRSDRFAPFLRQPAANGVITGQYGYWWLYRATPVHEAVADASGAGRPMLIGGIAIGLLIATGLTGTAVRRRAATEDERE